MKSQIITLVSLVCSISSFAQWTLIKKFNQPIKFIEATQQGIAIGLDSSYYVQQGSDLQNWLKFSVNDKIIDMDSKGNYLYFACPNRIYEHFASPIVIHEVNKNTSFQSINIYKGKKMISIATGYYGDFRMFCTFTTPFEKFDTLDYSTTNLIWPLQTVASDDNIAIIGYSNYYGGLVYNEGLKKWSGLNPLENEVVYDSYVNNQTIMARFKKEGTDFYISHDYGKTFKIKKDAFPFNSTEGSVIEYSDGNAFIGHSKYLNGVFKSTDDGETWANILPDSVITGMAVRGSDLFVTTNKGSLLKTPVKEIVTSVKKIEMESATQLYFSNKVIYNYSMYNFEFVIYDLTGKSVTSGRVNSKEQFLTDLNNGIYLIQYKSDKIVKTEKIYYW
jgi:hypothetical protein